MEKLDTKTAVNMLISVLPLPLKDGELLQEWIERLSKAYTFNKLEVYNEVARMQLLPLKEK